MPVYTYRREDGTTFDVRQSFTDAPLTLDPASGQKVVRIVQNAGVIFKGTGFYVNDSKHASKKPLSASNGSAGGEAAKEGGAPKEGDAAKSDAKVEASPAPSSAAAAAD